MRGAHNEEISDEEEEGENEADVNREFAALEEEFADLEQPRPISEFQVLSTVTKTIISKLAIAGRGILKDTSTSSALSEIPARLAGPSNNAPALDALFADRSLSANIERMDHADSMASWSSFVQLVNLVHFRLCVERYAG